MLSVNDTDTSLILEVQKPFSSPGMCTLTTSLGLIFISTLSAFIHKGLLDSRYPKINSLYASGF